MTIELNRRAQVDGTGGQLAFITSNTTSSSNPTRKFYTDATISAPVIDNSTYTYSVSFFVGTSDRFFIGAVRIKYTYTTRESLNACVTGKPYAIS